MKMQDIYRKYLRRNCTSNQNLAYFVRYFEHEVNFLKKTQEWRYNFSRPSGSWVINQNTISSVDIWDSAQNMVNFDLGCSSP